MTVYGIDFSGARDHARRTWIARLDEDHLTWVKREADLDQPLVEFLASARCLIGIDAPLALPAILMDGPWEQWALGFATRYPTAEAFRADCARRMPREIKRAVEREAQVPFAAWNLRLYRQTWRVISELVSPLLRRGQIIVLPQQQPRAGVTMLIEVCPASTLRRFGLRQPYKGSGGAKRSARERMAAQFGAPDIAIQDKGGDALDSIIAARTTAEAARARDWSEPVPGEGRIYF